jgi:hypothetical protein
MFRFVFLVAFTFSSTAHAGWFSYDSYEDCMLGRMKGQNQMMYSAADKACKKEFGVPEYISASNVKWAFNAGVIEIKESPPEFEITSGEFIFSEKSCEGLKREDYRKPETLKFSNGKAVIPRYPPSACASALSFEGKYK